MPCSRLSPMTQAPPWICRMAGRRSPGLAGPVHVELQLLAGHPPEHQVAIDGDALTRSRRGARPGRPARSRRWRWRRSRRWPGPGRTAPTGRATTRPAAPGPPSPPRGRGPRPRRPPPPPPASTTSHSGASLDGQPGREEAPHEQHAVAPDRAPGVDRVQRGTRDRPPAAPTTWPPVCPAEPAPTATSAAFLTRASGAQLSGPVERVLLTPMAYNMADLFEHTADVVGDREALVCGDETRTYAELESRSNRLAHHLAGAGIGPGDHVGHLRGQQHRVDRGPAGHLQDPGRAHQHQLPLRRIRAAATCSTTPTSRDWCTARSSGRGWPPSSTRSPS